MKLNIGCGPIQPDDWVNLDPDPQWRAPLASLDAIASGTVDGAVAHHVLQMIPWPELVPWLQEVRRVLRPGGYLRLSVPDLSLAGDMLDGCCPPPPISDEHEASVAGKVCLWLSQAGASRSVFTGPWLVELCQRAGFSAAGEVAPEATSGPAWLAALDLTPDRSDESAYIDAIA